MSAMFASAGATDAKRRADQLALALAELHLTVLVEPRDALAVLRATPDVLAQLAAAATRRAALALAKQHGFSHVAVELA